MRHQWLIALVVVLAMLLLFLLVIRDGQEPAQRTGSRDASDTSRQGLRVHVGSDADYAGSASCQECHTSQHSSWQKTWHRTMTQQIAPEPSSAASIAAPVGEHRLSSYGRDFVITRTQDDFRVEMPDPEWERQAQARGADLAKVVNAPRVDRPIVMSTGSHHYQAYWVHGSAGADLHQVPFIYHLVEGRWIPKESSFLQEPGPLAEFAVWNANCIQCHTVAGEPRLNRLTNRFSSRVVEPGIACEACHGPSMRHVELARSAASGDSLNMTALMGHTVNPARLTKQRSSEVCGQCHGCFVPHDAPTWWERGWRDQYRPGQELEATRTLIRHTGTSSVPEQASVSGQAVDNLYWPDGTVRVGGREYLGLLESPCHTQGEMTCLSCHSMHDYADPDDQLAHTMNGNEACLQCHEALRDQPELHTHHAPGSSGSLCYNCHMPHTSYALFKAIRSHRIDSPSAMTTRTTGRPNACNLCHLDKTLSWTANHLTLWFNQPPVELDDERQETSDTVIWLLRGDAAQRAVAVWATGWEPARTASGTDWMPPFLAQLMQDPYPVVRLMAHRSLRALSGYEKFRYDFLGDPEARAASSREVLEIWMNRLPSTHDSAGELLINHDGFIKQAAFDCLLNSRDDRRVLIAE